MFWNIQLARPKCDMYTGGSGFSCREAIDNLLVHCCDDDLTAVGRGSSSSSSSSNSLYPAP